MSNTTITSPHAPSFARRRLAGIAMVAVGALSTVVGMAPSPAGAADPIAVSGGQLDWAFSEHSQLSSSLAPENGAGAPAQFAAGSWSFPSLTGGSYDPATGQTDLAFGGSLEFGNIAQGNYGFQLSDVQIHVDAAGAGYLQADVATRGPGAPILKSSFRAPAQDVAVVTFDLATVEIVDDGSTVAWTVTPDYPLQGEEATFETPAFDGARQFPDSFLSVAGAFTDHFRDSGTAEEPNGTNPDKPPAPLTVSFDYSDTTTTSSSSTTSSSTTTSSTTTTSTTAPPTTTPIPPGAPEPSGSATVDGPQGQKLTVSPVLNLDPNGTTVTVSGSGYTPDNGFYLAFCVDNGAAAPTPCVGGADQSGDSGFSRFFSNDPTFEGLALAFDGTFETTLTLIANDGTVDCLDEATECVVATRADHTDASNRSIDVKVPVSFVGQTPPEDDPDNPDDTAPAAPSATIVTTDVRVGGPIVIEGAGFLAGEQVQVILNSDPVVLGIAIADADGNVSASMVIPAGTPTGTHHIELLGVTSGISASSSPFTITAAPSAGGGNLARTGGEPVGLIAFGIFAVLAGAILVRSSVVVRRR